MRVVIVGGGLAGLAAAEQLADHDVVIIERETRLGGRVRTRSGVDVGACFAVPSAVWPAGAAPVGERILERAPIAIRWEGNTYTGETARACLEAMPWSASERDALLAFGRGRTSASALPDRARRAIDAFFKQVHPGDVRDYVEARQKDVFVQIFPDHFPAGNEEVIIAYASRIHARVETGRTCVDIAERLDGVTVTHTGGAIECEAVIVATTADVARALVRPLEPETAAFLASVRYATYTVVALAFDADEAPELRYFLDPEGAPDVAVCRRGQLIAYYSRAADLDDAELISLALARARALGYRGAPGSTAVQRWPIAGTVITPEYARLKTRDHARATRRIFLAGDYLSPDPRWGYGTADAVASGRAAAARVRELCLTSEASRT